ncbi:1-aminocyclopropane-1-carboxylate oxidase homolog 1 [Linum perenne]
MKAGIGRFHELDVEQKKQFFECDDPTMKIVYNSNFDLYTTVFTNWRDTVQFAVASDPLEPEELPACRCMIYNWIDSGVYLHSSRLISFFPVEKFWWSIQFKC